MQKIIKWLKRKLLKNDKGFTLIELMIVVVILGILASIAIPRFNYKVMEAKDVKTQADIKIIQNAVDLFYLDFNDYPDSVSELVEEGYLHSEPLQVDGTSSYVIGENGRVSTD